MLGLLAALLGAAVCVGLSVVVLVKLLGGKKHEAPGELRRVQLGESGSYDQRPEQMSAAPTARPPELSGGESFKGIDIGGGRGFWFDVVGESNYQGTLRRVDNGQLEAGADVEVQCLIVPEPDNQYDSNALAVHVHKFGRVGYFQKDEAGGRYRLLGDRLRREGKVGTCIGKLIGGWDEDSSIGIRLALMTPSEVETGKLRPPKEVEPERLKLAATDWPTRPAIALDPGKRFGLNLVDEYLCQPELKRLAAERDPIKDSMGFDAALVPDGEAVVVCAIGGQPVGRLSKGDVGRYSVVRDHLVRSGAVGTCKAWIIIERDGLGARLSLRGPAALEKALGLLSVPQPPATE